MTTVFTSIAFCRCYTSNMLGGITVVVADEKYENLTLFEKLQYYQQLPLGEQQKSHERREIFAADRLGG